MAHWDDSKIRAGVQLILEGMAVDLKDHNFTDTPKRYAKAMKELFAQHEGEPTTFEEKYADFILVRGHEIYTLCPHHLLPVRMLVSVAYIPDGRVLGLSKLVRAMQAANVGPIMQERFTDKVKENLERDLGIVSTVGETTLAGNSVEISHYEPNQNGIVVLVEGWHGCMSMRGVKSTASTITMSASGHFEDDPAMLDRFLMLVRR